MLYTGKGDGGTTKTFDAAPGVRISKASELPEALGALDELNAFLGFAKMRVCALGDFTVPVGSKKRPASVILRSVQETLFIAQAEVAGAEKKVGKGKVTDVEKVIAAIEGQIAPVTAFSIAGGTELSAMLDFARTISRRTRSISLLVLSIVSRNWWAAIVLRSPTACWCSSAVRISSNRRL